jgi:N-acetylneuraminic acid mutarotase
MSPLHLAPALLLMTAIASVAAPAHLPLHGWQLLAPVPDPVGYAGMFAGVLGDRVVTGGGSQFRDKPNWLQGTKVFSDRIFVLADPAGKWTEHATRLPTPMGSFASATTRDAIYLVGGINATGCLAGAWELRADGNGFRFTSLPDFPHPIGYAAAAIVGARLYVVGGLTDPASKTPSVETWSLALADSPSRAWRREPDLPAPGVFVCAAASDGASVYAFGGIGFDATGKPIPSAAAHRLTPDGKAWTRLADLPGPRVGPASPCPFLEGKKFFLVGGYAEVFPGAARDHPGFSAQTLFYEPARNAWANGPLLPNAPVPDRDSPGDPGPMPMIGSPAVVWRDRVIVISGEVRASVRSPAVLAWPLGARSP